MWRPHCKEREVHSNRDRVRGEEGVAFPCCYCSANKGLKEYFMLFLLFFKPLHTALPSNSNMEVLTSKNRMSATPFLPLYFSEYVTGLLW